MRTFSISAGMLAFAVTLTAVAGSIGTRHDWPQWRGPLATGAAPESNPPLEWSETKNVKWKVAIPGEGSSTPVVWDNRVFVLSAVRVPKPAETKSAEDNAAGLKPADPKPADP